MASPRQFTESIARIAAFVVVFLAFSANSSAQIEEEEPKVPSVVVLPWVYDGTKSPLENKASLFRSEAISFLQTNDRNVANVLDDRALVRTVRSNEVYAERTQVAREWMSLGIKNYQALDVSEAIPNLSRGLEGFQKFGHVFVDPTEVAELLMYLALASLESQSADVTFALDKFQQMSLIAPEREIREGVYPQQVVQFYRSAIVAIEKEIDETGIPNTELVRATADTVGADYVIAFSILGGERGPGDVVMGIFDIAENRALEPVRMRAPKLDEPTLRELTSRLTSRFVTCLEPPSEAIETPVPKSEGTGRWAMQLNFSYLSFFEFPGPPDLVPFGNAGGTVGVSYYVTREFALRGAVEVLTSIRDRNAAVSEPFQTLRGFAGGEVGTTIGPVRLSLGANVEAVFLPEVKICIPADYRARFESCPEFISGDRFGAFGGLNLRPRVSLIANSSFDVFSGGNAGFYVLPFSKGSVNFPAAGELGLQYRF